MKELKDYLHLYLGCQFVMKIDNPNSEHHGLFTAPMHFGSDVLQAAHSRGDYKIYPILILRKLEDMSEEESGCLQKFGGSWGITNRKYALERMFGSPHHGCHGVDVAALTAHLLSKGFDLFGLIDAGLAVNAKDLKV